MSCLFVSAVLVEVVIFEVKMCVTILHTESRLHLMFSAFRLMYLSHFNLTVLCVIHTSFDC